MSNFWNDPFFSLENIDAERANDARLLRERRRRDVESLTINVGDRCPGCHVVCDHLDVEHLDDCPYQGRDALTLADPVRAALVARYGFDPGADAADAVRDALADETYIGLGDFDGGEGA